jgi:hypothetical protein
VVGDENRIHFIDGNQLFLTFDFDFDTIAHFMQIGAVGIDDQLQDGTPWFNADTSFFELILPA